MTEETDPESYKISFEFEITDDELEGLSPCEAFVLGFEFSQVTEIVLDIKLGGSCPPRPVHAKNSSRIRAFARAQGIPVWLSPEIDGWRKVRFQEPEE